MVDRITWQGANVDTTNPANNPNNTLTVNTFQIYIYSSAGSVPNAPIDSVFVPFENFTRTFVGIETSVNEDGPYTVPIYEYDAVLPSTLEIPGGETVWLSILGFNASFQPHFSWTSGGLGGTSTQLPFEGSYTTQPGDRNFILHGATFTPPTISSIGNVTIDENSSPEPILFAVDDPEQDPGALIVSAASSNQSLIPNGNITINNLGGMQRELAFTPALNAVGGPVTITVTVDDGMFTAQETFQVTILPGADPPEIEFSQASYVVSENGTPQGVAVTLRRTGHFVSPSQVTVDLSGGSAEAGVDYGITPVVVSFGTTEKSKTVVLPLLQDTLVEPLETVELSLSADTNASLGDQVTALLTIDDDDVAALTVSKGIVLEGNSGTVDANFRVTLDRDVAVPFTVNYSTQNDSALAGQDFIQTGGILNFSGVAGETTTIAVTVNGDASPEQTEQFLLELDNLVAGGAKIQLVDGTGMILSDDAAPGTVTWIAPGSGDWYEAANWVDNHGVNRVPNPVDAIILSVSATPYTVSIHEGELAALTTGTLDMRQSSTLRNDGEFRLAGAGSIETRSDSHIHNRSGGLLNFGADGDINWNAGATMPLVTNEGTIRKSGGTAISFVEGIINLNGVIEVQSGELQLQSNGTSSGGIFNVSAGALLDLTGGQSPIYGGTYTGSGDGTISWDGGTVIPGADAVFDFPSGLLVWDRGFLGAGTLTNIGAMTIAHTSITADRLASGAIIHNEGVITLTAHLNTASGSELHNHAGALIEFVADGDINWSSGPTMPLVTNEGTVQKSGGTGQSFMEGFVNLGGVIEVLSGELQLQGNGVNTGGTFNLSPGALLDLTGGQSPTYAGTYTGSGGGTISWDNGTVIPGTDAVFNFPAGLLVWDNGFMGSGTLTNVGTITIAHTSITQDRLSSGAILENEGTIILSANLHMASGSELHNREGALIDFVADGDINWTTGTTVPLVTNEGTVRKSSGTLISFIEGLQENSGEIEIQSGTLQISNDFLNSAIVTIGAGAGLEVRNEFTNTGTLNFEIAGTPTSGMYGRVQVLTDANLGGTLNANVIGYVANIGDVYSLITFDAKTGTFADYSSDTFLFTTQENPEDVSITVVQAFDADFDLDGDVDGRDFLRWQRGYGTANADRADGDADDDDDVDGMDLAVWRAQYGALALSALGSLRSEEVRSSLRGSEHAEVSDTRAVNGSVRSNLETVARPAGQAESSTLVLADKYVEEVDRAIEQLAAVPRGPRGFGEMVARRDFAKRQSYISSVKRVE